jgi:energy-coupling factor transporter ATP-binding protein EcfA2
MLVELSITNLAIIEHTRIRFQDGLNAITGETGAGKSILLDALGAVLGARVSSDLVRTGAKSALVEAQFELPAASFEIVIEMLLEYGIEHDPTEPLIFNREIQASGLLPVSTAALSLPVSSTLWERCWSISTVRATIWLSWTRTNSDASSTATTTSKGCAWMLVGQCPIGGLPGVRSTN